MKVVVEGVLSNSHKESFEKIKAKSQYRNPSRYFCPALRLTNLPTELVILTHGVNPRVHAYDS